MRNREDPSDRLKTVRKLEIRYTSARPGAARLFVERVGGEVAVCEVDCSLVEDFLEDVCRTDDRMASCVCGRKRL